MLCPHCSEPVSHLAARCPHCNGWARGSEERAHSTIQCPRCQVDAELVLLGPIVVDHCTECGSVWFDNSELERTSSAADGACGVDLRDAVRALIPQRRRDWGPALAPCPLCSCALLRRDHPTVPSVIAHVCKAHGAWLERRCLLKLMKDLEVHGLARLGVLEGEREGAHEDQQRAAKEHRAWMLRALRRNLLFWFW